MKSAQSVSLRNYSLSNLATSARFDVHVVGSHVGRGAAVLDG